MSNKKVIDLDEGRYMVVADIHGNIHDYCKVIQTYNKKKKLREVDGLIFAGDIVHSYGGDDGSRQIIDDLINHQMDNNVHVLLGNHEIAHIYNFTLPTGKNELTHEFETDIKSNREKYVGFLKSLPIYARTKGGVVISHAGASKKVKNIDDIINLNHDEIIQENKKEFDSLTSEEKENFKELLEKKLYGLPYDEAFKLLRGTEPDDSLLEGEFLYRNRDENNEFKNVDTEWLYDIFFNTNEKFFDNGKEKETRKSSSDYMDTLTKFLATMSEDYTPQNLLVSGHMHQKSGIDIFKNKQLRITSSAQVDNDTVKSYLVVDAEKKYSSAMELLDNVHSLYPETIDKTLLAKVEELSKKYPILTPYNIYNLKKGKTVTMTGEATLDDLERLKLLQNHLDKKRYESMLEGGIKPKNAKLNKNLLSVIEELERKSISIEKIQSDGGSLYDVMYKIYDVGPKQSEQIKGLIQVKHNAIIEHNKEYGPILLQKDPEYGFISLTNMELPIKEVESEDGEKKILVGPSEPFPAKDEFVDKALEFIKEQHKKGMPKELVTRNVLNLAFKRSVLEKPYTKLSEKEFIEEFLK